MQITISRLLFLLLFALLFVAGIHSRSPEIETNCKTGSRFYLVVRARTCSPQEVKIEGASNLPVGSILTLQVSDFLGDGWTNYSEETYVTLRADGFFEATIQPVKGKEFHRNLLIQASFIPWRPKQPADVLGVVERHGRNLGGIKNPQVNQVSGWNYQLDTMERVPFCGEGLAH